MCSTDSENIAVTVSTGAYLQVTVQGRKKLPATTEMKVVFIGNNVSLNEKPQRPKRQKFCLLPICP